MFKEGMGSTENRRPLREGGLQIEVGLKFFPCNLQFHCQFCEFHFQL